MGNTKNIVYDPDDGHEELLMLMGRVNALAAYVRDEKYDIPRKIIAAMLGFNLEDGTCSTSE